MTATLKLRESRETHGRNLSYSEFSEDWEVGNSSFSYYRIKSNAWESMIEEVSFDILPFGVFDDSGSALWLCGINPVALFSEAGRQPQRFYEFAYRVRRLIGLYETKNGGELGLGDFINLLGIFNKGNTDKPQSKLERIIEITKPPKMSREEIVNIVYRQVVLARDKFLEQARSIPNPDISRVIGSLELKKPEIN